MRRPPDLQSLGTRLLLSYLAASLAAALSGVLALFLTPALRYDRLMQEIMHPPAGATTADMDAILANAVASAVLLHVLISLVVVVLVGLAFSIYLSRAVGQAVDRVAAATRKLAKGDYSERVPERGVRELSELTRDINLLAASLDEARRARALATASVSHELRTPVTALRGYCDALKDGVLPWSDAVLQRIDLAVERLEHMARDLSALSRAEGNAYVDLAIRPLKAKDTLAEAAEAVRSAFDGAGVRLVLCDVPEQLAVLADRVRLAEILENLLLNSLRHTPAGRDVILTATPAAGRLAFEVRDEGSGIKPEDLPHVMEPFYRGEGGSAGHTSRPGMGLGLAIARRLAEAMDGTLTIASPGPGQGAVAKVSLPML